MTIESTWKETAKSLRKKHVAYQLIADIGVIVVLAFSYWAGAAGVLSSIVEDRAAKEEEES